MIYPSLIIMFFTLTVLYALSYFDYAGGSDCELPAGTLDLYPCVFQMG